MKVIDYCIVMGEGAREVMDQIRMALKDGW